MYSLTPKLYNYIYDNSTTTPKLLTYKTLTKQQLIDIYSLSTFNNKLAPSILQYNIVLFALTNQEMLDKLSDKQMKELADKIVTHSHFIKDDYKKLSDILDLYLTKELEGETWNCDTCKSKRLQTTRNCPYLKEKVYTDFSMYINGQIYTECPIYKIQENKELLSNAMAAYYYLEKKTLPNSGGLFDQTEFFIEASSLVDNKIKEKERKELQKSMKE